MCPQIFNDDLPWDSDRVWNLPGVLKPAVVTASVRDRNTMRACTSSRLVCPQLGIGIDYDAVAEWCNLSTTPERDGACSDIAEGDLHAANSVYVPWSGCRVLQIAPGRVVPFRGSFLSTLPSPPSPSLSQPHLLFLSVRNSMFTIVRLSSTALPASASVQRRAAAVCSQAQAQPVEVVSVRGCAPITFSRHFTCVIVVCRIVSMAFRHLAGK